MNLFLISFFFILPQWTHAASPVEFKNTGTYPELWVEGKPFFIHAAHFPYARLPRDIWENSLETYKAMGINTIDFYVPWNWHEPEEGRFDFAGATNPRRDVVGLLQIISKLGLKAIIRPGPYICAEWKNGGYPDWLLKRPEYKMPLRSILEGRYPPLSSLQYADSEKAAQAWLVNRTHLNYTEQWYKAVADKVIKPFSIETGGPVILVQLDDDQPAGDRTNGPYFWKYMDWLRSTIIHSGVSLPVFLNPSESLVPPLSRKYLKDPLWSMDQWYQRFYGVDLSTANYAALESAVQYLKTDPQYPPSMVEFNAGFFNMEDDPYGMKSDASNTLTASRVFLQNGLKGLVYFPLQDSLYPAGYEIPSTNRHYAWESALDVSGRKKDKAPYVERNGHLLATVGPLLASSHEWADVGLISPLAAAGFPALSSSAIDSIKSQIEGLEQTLIRKQITSEFVDPEFEPLENLRRYPVILEVTSKGAETAVLSSLAQSKLKEYVAKGGKLVRIDASTQEAEKELAALGIESKIKSSQWVYATELVSDAGTQPSGVRSPGMENYGFLAITNLSAESIKTQMAVADPYDSQTHIDLGDVNVPKKDSLFLPLRIRFTRILSDLPSFLDKSDEIRWATAELQGAQSDHSSVRLTFYASEPSKVALQLKQEPKFVFLDGKKMQFLWDAQNHLVVFHLPPSKKKDHLQTLILTDSANSSITRPPAILASAPGDATSEGPLWVRFPTQVADQIRSDFRLDSSPPLIYATQFGPQDHFSLSVVITNLSNRTQIFSLQWNAKDIQLAPAMLKQSLGPRQQIDLDFDVRVAAGPVLRSATLTLRQGNISQDIPVRIAILAQGKAHHYSFDLDRDGNEDHILENQRIRVVVSPVSGGRILQMISKRSGRNIVAGAGAAREIFSQMAPLDITWDGEKLPDWTRSRTPGLATRHYVVDRVFEQGKEAGVSMSYEMPDISPSGGRIEKTISLNTDDPTVTVQYNVTLPSSALGQTFKIHDVLLLDPGSSLLYSEKGRVKSESFDKDLQKTVNVDWIGIQTPHDTLVIEPDSGRGSLTVQATVTAKRNYVVVEITLGSLLEARKVYSYKLLYHYGREAMQLVHQYRRKR